MSSSNNTAETAEDAPKKLSPREEEDRDRKVMEEEEEEEEEKATVADEERPAQLVVPPDGGWGWVVAFASFMCNVVVDGIIFSFGVFMEPIGKEFGLPVAKVALVGSLLSGFYLLVGPFVSALANRYGFRLVAWLGSALSAIAFCLSYHATDVEFLYLSYGVAGGIGFGLCYVPAVIAVGFYFERWRALATGIAVCGSGIGAFVLAPIFSVLVANIGWRKTMFVQAALAASCAIFGSLFRPLKPITVPLSEMQRLDETAVNGSAAAETASHPNRQQQQQQQHAPPVRRASHAYPTAAEAWSRSTASLHKSAHSLAPTAAGAAGSRRGSGVVRSRRGTMSSSQADASGGARPLYRDDIFFGGSLARLPQYTSRTSLGYTMSVTRLPTRADLAAEERERGGRTSDGGGCRFACPVAVRRALATLLDVSLLNSPSFVVLALSGGLTMMGFYVPFMYLPERAAQGGMVPERTMWLISAIGVCNTLGRLLCGLVSSSFPQVDTLLVNNIAICIGGLSTLLSGLSTTDTYQFMYCCVFGLSIACFASLRSVIMVELVGLDKLTNAFGLSLVFQGVAASIGAPLAGAFTDYTGNHDATFYLSGTLILLSGLMCFPLRAVSRWETRRRKEAAADAAAVSTFIV